MKWFKPLYYVVVSLVTACLLFACIAFPLAFLLAVPIGVFLFMVPSILQGEKFKSAEVLSEREKVAELEKEVSGLKTQINNLTVSHKIRDDLLTALIPCMPGGVFECYVACRLGEKGFYNLNVTPQSRDFGADVLATSPEGQKVCVQCKRYSNPVGLEAVQEIASARSYYKCDRAIVITNTTFTPAARELAAKTNVELWGKFV